MEAYANRKSRRRAHTGLTDASPLLRARNAKLAINRHRRESDATKPFGEEDEQELFNHAQIDETDPDQLEYVSRFFRDLQRPLSRTTTGRLRLRIAAIIEADYTHALVFLVIVSNAVLIGFEADKLSYDWTQRVVWWQVNCFFVVFFVLELALRVFVFRRYFFLDRWNCGDAGIVVLGLLTTVVTALVNAYAEKHNERFNHQAQLVRLLRILRIIKFFSTLKKLVNALMKAMSSVLWVVVLIILYIYIFAVAAVVLFGSFDIDGSEAEEFTNLTEGGTLRQYWGSVPRAMATLLQLMTFDDWLSMVRNIEVIVPGSWLFFVGFVMMGALGFLNLMTAVFVDSIILLQNVEAHQRAQAKERWVQQVRSLCSRLFQIIDVNGDHSLTKDEVLKVLVLMGQRQQEVERGGLIPDDALTKIMIDMEELDINSEDALASLLVWIKDRQDVSLRELVSCMTEAREPTLKEDAMNIERKILRLNESLIELDDHVRTLEETVSGEIYELRMSLRRLETKLCADGAGPSAPFSVGNASKVDEMMARLEKLTRIVSGTASSSAPPPVPMEAALTTLDGASLAKLDRLYNVATVLNERLRASHVQARKTRLDGEREPAGGEVACVHQGRISPQKRRGAVAAVASSELSEGLDSTRELMREMQSEMEQLRGGLDALNDKTDSILSAVSVLRVSHMA